MHSNNQPLQSADDPAAARGPGGLSDGSATMRTTATVQARRPGPKPTSVAWCPVAVAWEAERAKRLQAICLRLDAHFTVGHRGISKVWQRESRRLQGKPYRSVPTRRWAMSPSRLRNLFYLWRRRGRTASVFAIRWDRSVRPLVDVDFIRVLAGYCSAPGVTGFRDGYNRMATRRTLRGGKMPVSYSTACRYLPLEKFQAVREAHRRLAQAEHDLGRAIAQFHAGALALVPPKRTRERPLNFEI